MYGMKRINAMLTMGLASLSSFAALGMAVDKMKLPGHRFAAGKIYISRSRYTPGGPNRNCGDKGISPKLLARRA